jgi:hypothetical protein
MLDSRLRGNDSHESTAKPKTRVVSTRHYQLSAAGKKGSGEGVLLFAEGSELKADSSCG